VALRIFQIQLSNQTGRKDLVDELIVTCLEHILGSIENRMCGSNLHHIRLAYNAGGVGLYNLACILKRHICLLKDSDWGPSWVFQTIE